MIRNYYRHIRHIHLTPRCNLLSVDCDFINFIAVDQSRENVQIMQIDAGDIGKSGGTKRVLNRKLLLVGEWCQSVRESDSTLLFNNLLVLFFWEPFEYQICTASDDRAANIKEHQEAACKSR